ncbi:PREDICTED: uncharacterized protein LOC109467765 [Branchiostoma belcheri]|uniref:Uncharacterized protein LOC109467765 n=1 Tax=Branchiostoma belcheri TaxID=7741 RepID=A0A6P4XXK7_BRABE|nr:PREDICTED: uncharacterized protein LOC109467765 [Branchiostoma belcheri]
MADACRKSGNGGNFGANGNARLFPRTESRGIQPPGGCREHGKSLLMYCMVCEEECCLQCIKEPGGRHPAGSPQHNVKNKYVATSLRKVSLMDISIGCRKTQMKITDVEMALSNNARKAISEIKSQMEAIKQALDLKTVQMVASVKAERAEKQERLDAIKRGLNAIREDSRFLLAEGGNSEKFLQILRHNVTGKARVLMWNDGTYSVQANHYITADMKLLDDKIGGDDALVWAGIDAADGSRKEAYFAATFSQPTAATVYKKVFERCVARETVKERTASAGTPP